MLQKLKNRLTRKPLSQALSNTARCHEEPQVILRFFYA